MTKATATKIPSNRRLVRSTSGIEFDVYSHRWQLKEDGNQDVINISYVVGLTSPEFEDNIRRVFAAIAETRPGNTAAVMFYAFRTLVAHAEKEMGQPLQTIELEHLASWAYHVASKNMSFFSHIRSIALTWQRLRIPGFSDDAVDLATRLQRPKDPSVYGAVLSWDPIEGPYRPVENEAIREAIDLAFNDGRIDLFNYALIRTFRATAARPESVSRLKIGDLRSDNGKTFIRIPMAKQKGAAWRELFMPWKPITQGFAQLLQMHIEANVRPRLDEHIKLDDAPLFPRARGLLTGDSSFHARPNSLSVTYRKAFEELCVFSPISGEPIHGTPKRDRHTFLTMLAMNGCTAEEIAANAGHEKVISCEAYVHAGIDHFQRMEKLVGSAFIPIAERFAGIVLSSRDDDRSDDPLIDTEANEVGSCAQGGCNAIEAGVAPFACYSCRKFRAWSDAPHAALLEMLLEDQERLREAGHDAVAETRTTTIIAIGDLLERISLEAAANG